MSATLKITSNFLVELNGVQHSGKQGTITDGIDDPFEVTVDGKIHHIGGTLATATVVTLWDEDSASLPDFDYGWFWADQDCYLQLIAQATNVIFKVEAKVPFWVPGFDQILAAANTTAITGGTEPTMSDLDSLVLGNYSGNTLNYALALID